MWRCRRGDGGLPCEEHGPLSGAADAGRRSVSGAAANPDRRTAYDLIAVEKGDKLINMDAQAPNRVFAEWAHIFDPAARLVKPEFTFGRSRLDFCLQGPQGLHLVEVKGVTLEDGGHACFPMLPRNGVSATSGSWRAPWRWAIGPRCFL